MIFEELFGLTGDGEATATRLTAAFLGLALALVVDVALDRRDGRRVGAARPALIVLSVVLALLAWNAGASAAAGNGRPALLVVITGQSNAAQQGAAGQLAAAERGPVEGVWYYAPQHTRQTRVVPMQPYGGAFGVELSFARTARAACGGREVLIAKTYSGGTSIIAWDDNAPGAAWRREMAQVGNSRKPAMYPRVLQVKRDAERAYGRPVEMAGVLYLQTERDSRYRYGAERYEANLRQLIGALRRDWGAAGLPAVFMDSHTHLATGGPLVHEAVVAVAGSTPRAAWVPVRDLPKKPDHVHFATDGVVELGRRLAAEWVAMGGCEG
jgi:hypothetical protein